MLLGCWCVCQAIAWLLARLAEEESLAVTEVLAKQTKSGQASPTLPMKTSSFLDFLVRPLKIDLLNGCYVTLAALIGMGAYLIYGAGLGFVLWSTMGWGLLILASVDAKTKLLPDVLTLPLLWLGIVIQLFPETRTVGLELSVIGAVAGYLPLWLLAHLYKLIRGRDGLGMGDLKLLAAMGAWSGPFLLPQVLLLAALLAIAVFVLERVLRRSSTGIHEERPFGPAIVAAYFIVMAFAY